MKHRTCIYENKTKYQATKPSNAIKSEAIKPDTVFSEREMSSLSVSHYQSLALTQMRESLSCGATK